MGVCGPREDDPIERLGRDVQDAVGPDIKPDDDDEDDKPATVEEKDGK